MIPQSVAGKRDFEKSHTCWLRSVPCSRHRGNSPTRGTRQWLLACDGLTFEKEKTIVDNDNKRTFGPCRVSCSFVLGW